MKILLKNHIESATEALKNNRGRTLLTITGVTIGIASMTMVLSLTGGVHKLFNTQQHTPSIDTPVAIIKSGGQKTGTNLFTDSDSLTTVNSLTEKDVSAIDKLPEVSAAPIAFLHAGLKAREGKINTQNAALIGSTGSLKDIANLSVSSGQFIDEASGIVVGHQLSIDLFGTENSIGNVVTIRNQPLTVVGVLKKIETPVQFLHIDLNSAAIVPVSTIKRFTQGTAQIQQIAVRANSQDQLAQALPAINKTLQQNHASDQDYRILTDNEINENKSTLIRLLSIMMAIIGGISLLVGGIGIMNIMLVSVVERQREVGVRRAVGATGQQIINQFLIESAIIGFLGGIFGCLLGIGGAYLVGSQLTFTPYIYWHTALFVVIVSIGIGLLAGLYPAFRATRRDPIESLRY